MMNIQIIWDSSVAPAPAGFTADVQQVANFFASEIKNPITITIDVGYGEINGSSISGSALGKSETYLQQVSYSQLRSAYAVINNFPSSPRAANSMFQMLKRRPSTSS
jgi:hypothetical protein